MHYMNTGCCRNYLNRIKQRTDGKLQGMRGNTIQTCLG